MIVAVAGRRIDAIEAKQIRFRLQNAKIVKARVRTALQNLGASALVCSAACGGDLIALCEARWLGLRRKIVLPFDRERFRETSVIDRPGDWGDCYDKAVDQVEAVGDLVIVTGASDENAYSVTNDRILDEAISLGKQVREPVTALLIWEGASRGDGDFTAAFGVEAQNRGLAVAQVRSDQPDTTE